MKLLASIVAASVTAVSVPRSCIDQNLGDICSINCQNEMIECYTNCAGNQICMSDCSRNFPLCENACPCGSKCPLGCADCEHPMCDRTTTDPITVPTTGTTTTKSSSETMSTTDSTTKSTSSTRSTRSTTTSTRSTRTRTQSSTHRPTLPELPDVGKCGVMTPCGDPVSQGNCREGCRYMSCDVNFDDGCYTSRSPDEDAGECFIPEKMINCPDPHFELDDKRTCLNNNYDKCSFCGGLCKKLDNSILPSSTQTTTTRTRPDLTIKSTTTVTTSSSRSFSRTESTSETTSSSSSRTITRTDSTTESSTSRTFTKPDSSSTQSSTESNPTKPPGNNGNIMILNTFGDNSPLILSSDGEELTETGFELTDYVEAYGSCMATLEGVTYLFGGATQHRQLSRLTDCQFDRIGSTQFDFSFGACGTFEDEGQEFVLLCFDHNHPYMCYVMTHSHSGYDLRALEHDTDNAHDYGRLAKYGNYPLTLGSKYGSHNRAEMLTAKGKRWTQLPPYSFHDSIHSYATVSIDNEVIVLGGYVGRYGEVATIGKLDHSRQWIHLGQLLERRHGHAATISNSSVLIIGGEGKRHVERHSLTGHEATLTAARLDDYKFYPYIMSVDNDFCPV